MEKSKLGSKLILYGFSAILIICQALVFLFPPLLPPGLTLPIFFKCLPLLALLILWLKRLIFREKRGVSVLKAIFWLMIIVVSLGALLETEFSLFTLVDREKKEAPVTMGTADSSKTVNLVFHPGGSGLVRTINSLVAEKLAQNGFQINLFTAHTGLKLIPKSGSILGLVSPVYFGNIRPPLLDFIQRTDLTGVKCFVILTGSVDRLDEVQNLKKIIESKGGIFLSGRKFLSTIPPENPEIELFVNEVIHKFSL